MKVLAISSSIFLIVLGALTAAPTRAQTQTDTIRDLLTLVYAKQPDTQVTLENIGDKYPPYGTISHIGDDYACVMRTAQNGPTTFNTETCVPFNRITSVEMIPGIHR